MTIKPLVAFFVLDMKNTLRDRVAIAMLFLFPLVMYLFFGSFFGAMKTAASAKQYYDQYTISFISVILLNIAFLNLGPTIVIAKDAGFFRRMMVTPLRVSDLWLASVARTLIIFAIGYAQMVLAGWMFLGQWPKASVLQLAVPALVSSFTMLSFGFLLGAVYKRPVASFNGAMLLIQPMLLLSGAGMPLTSFPHWAEIIALMLPFTYVVNIMKMGWDNQFFVAAAVQPVLILLGIGIVSAVAANRIFRADFR